MNIRCFGYAVVVLFFSAATGCVTASQGEKMEKDIQKLKKQQDKLDKELKEQKEELTKKVSSAREDVQELRSVLKKAKDLLQRNSEDFGSKLDRLQQEVQKLRGRSEENAFHLKKLEQELTRFKEDAEIRFASGNALQKDMPESGEDLYQYGKNQFSDENYRVARRAFETFLISFSDHDRTPDVRYYLGEIHYNNEQWVSAIFEYRKLLNQHAGSERVVDATLRIGQAFTKLGRCEDAKPFFETVIKDYGNSENAEQARQYLQEIESGRCSE